MILRRDFRGSGFSRLRRRAGMALKGENAVKHLAQKAPNPSECQEKPPFTGRGKSKQRRDA